MNWVTTNIRLPEDLYLDLRMEAARSRKSTSQIIRDRLSKDRPKAKSNVWERVEKYAIEMSKKYPGLNLSDKLIEMRYEQ